MVRSAIRDFFMSIIKDKIKSLGCIYGANNYKCRYAYGDRSSVVEQRFVDPLAAGSIPVDRPICTIVQ